MGKSVSVTNFPCIKGTSGILLMTLNEAQDRRQTNCIRCGRCIRSCPMGLAPQQMMLAAKRGDLDRFIALHGLDCIQCGCCTYTCPARQPLVPTFKLFKPRAMAYNRAKQAAEKGGK